MKTKGRIQKKKTVSYSVLKMTEERIRLLENESLSGKVFAEDMDDILRTLSLEFFKTHSFRT